MREILSFRQPWIGSQHEDAPQDRPSFLRDLLRPIGRYRSPLSARERLAIELERRIAEKGDPEPFPADPSYPVPPRWQLLIRHLYDEGIIARPQIQFEQLFHDEAKIHSLRLWAASPEGKTDGGVQLMGGGYSRGVSRDLEEAISKVIGELLERYPLALYRDRDLLRASVEDLRRSGAHFLNPFLVAQFSEAQKQKFPNRRFDEKSVFRWVKGRSFSADREALIPAQLVFWNYRFEHGEPLLQQPITNGAAGHFTKDEAILAGLYELIQRDAFFVHWLNRIAPPRIDPASVKHAGFEELLRDLTRYRVRPELLDITSDIGVPAFVCVLSDESGKGPAIALGGGCDPRAEAAIVRATTEAMGVSHWLRMKEEYFALPEPYEPFAHPLSQEDRLKLWGNPAMRARFDFFLSGPRVALAARGHNGTLSGRTKKEELLHVVRALEKKGEEYEVFFYEASHPILDRLGYHSVAVAVPALLPLYLNETVAPLAAQRIQEAPPLLGYAAAAEVNPLPHPFP